MEQETYVMIKPEFANNKYVIAEVGYRLIENGLKIEKEGYILYDKARAKRHYHEHVGKSFYGELEEYITSDKAFGMKVVGEDAISKVRALAGATKNPEPGTIRYDIPKALGIERDITKNVVHSSDSEDSAKLELSIFEELLSEKDLNK